MGEDFMRSAILGNGKEKRDMMSIDLRRAVFLSTSKRPYAIPIECLTLNVHQRSWLVLGCAIPEVASKGCKLGGLPGVLQAGCTTGGT
jgi:hypothetical protein